MEDKYIYQFERLVLDRILERRMIMPGQTVLTAVSGGADSVCLLAVLKKLEAEVHFHLRAVHVEHGIRGQESMDDAAYVEKLCGELGVALDVEHIKVPRLAEESGRTIEEEARVQRYCIFHFLAEKTGAQRVAVAHNMGDLAETVLWNLIRGSSIRGLAGIRPSRPLDQVGTGILVIRPLLSVSRQEIERYLAARGISFRTDRTNHDREITRNAIRLDIMPRLKELNEKAQEHIAAAASQAAEAEDFLERVTEKAALRCVREERTGEGGKTMPVLVLEPFFREDPLVQKRVLRECIRLSQEQGGLKDIGQVHVEDLMKLAFSSNGKSVNLKKGVRAVREEGIVRFALAPDGHPEDAAKAEEAVKVSVPFCGERVLEACGTHFRMVCGQAGPGPVSVPEKRFTKWIAYATINPNEMHTLCFRTRKPGDYLVVSAGGGRKKLSDYLIDEKVPREKRDQVIVLAEGSRILWVVGGRIGEDAKVGPGDFYLKVEDEDERDSQRIDSGGKGRGEDTAAC